MGARPVSCQHAEGGALPDAPLKHKLDLLRARLLHQKRGQNRAGDLVEGLAGGPRRPCRHLVFLVVGAALRVAAVHLRGLWCWPVAAHSAQLCRWGHSCDAVCAVVPA